MYRNILSDEGKHEKTYQQGCWGSSAAGEIDSDKIKMRQNKKALEIIY